VAAQVAGRDSLPVVSHIVLDRRNVFDQNEATFWLLRLVNKLHVMTHPAIVRNELLFGIGQPYDSARVAETARNLRRLGIFRNVSIDTVTADTGFTVRVVTQDGWSTRPDFRFHSTGNSIAYTLALIEDNLLGTATSTRLLYRKDPDRTTTTLGLHRTRLIAHRIGTDFQYDHRSDGHLATGLVSLPFFSDTSRFGGSLYFDTRRERVLQFRDGATIASDTSQRHYTLGFLSLGRALGVYRTGYVRLGVTAQVRRDDFLPQSAVDSGRVPGRTVSGAAGVWIEARRSRNIVVQGYQGFGRNEDVDLSDVATVSVLAAPSGFGYTRGGFAPGIALHAGRAIPGGFVYADFGASGLYTSAGLDSGQVNLSATAVLLPSVKHQFLFHAQAGAIRNPLPGAEYDLGLGAGPRGFRQHAFTGDRSYFATAEYRYSLTPEFLKLMGVGIAAFADHGGAWWHGDPVRRGWDVGVGLRLGPSRATDQEINRIDLTYRFANDRQPGGWVLVVAKGFVFSSNPRGGE
jgi:hypothetical protein